MNDQRQAWLTQPGGVAPRLASMLTRSTIRTQTALAEQLGWSQARVSRLKNGLAADPDDIRAWAHACGFPDEGEALVKMIAEYDPKAAGWRERLATGHLSAQRAHTILAETATAVRVFEMSMVPGELQTRAYAEATMLRTGAPFGVTDVAAGVAERMRRVALTYDPARTFHFLVLEGVLRSGPASAAAMDAQLQQIAELAALDHVTFQVIPMAPDQPVVPINSFKRVDLPSGPIVIVENYIGEPEHHSDDDLATYQDVWDGLVDAAWDPERSIGALQSVVG